MLYPFVFQPILKQHSWGGRNLERLYQKPLPPETLIGESWEISDRDEAVSVIANGPLAGRDLRWLMEHQAADLLGESHAPRGRFPLLVKILDATQAPSIQVHPRPEVTERLGGEPKTELWYVTQATPGACLYVGLRRGIKRGQFERKISDGTVRDCLHPVPIQAGDALFVPSGRVHTIGAGSVIFEIQENSNTTYRVFDWNRLGSNGRPRELHVEQAMAAIDFDDFEPGLVAAPLEEREGVRFRLLADHESFTVWERQMRAGFPEPLTGAGRPLIIGLVAGALTLRHPATDITVALAPGQFCLLPASAGEVLLEAGQPATYLLAEPAATKPDTQTASATTQRQVVPPWEAYQACARSPDAGSAHGIAARWRRMKRGLAKRLTYSPFLRMLVLKFWFRTVVLAFVLVGLVVAVMLPRVWTFSPPGFMPVVRGNLLDKLKARMLRSTARRAMADRDFGAAADAWWSAFGNNPADPDLARSLIQNLLGQDDPGRSQLRRALKTVPWLLRLTRTNRSDVELAVRTYEKVQMYSEVYELLEPLTNHLSAPLELSLTRAALFERRVDEFAQRWERLSPQQKEDPETALCHAALLAGWGPPETIREGRERLLAVAAGDSRLRNIANQMLLTISAGQADLSTFEEALRRLEERHADTGANHATHWVLSASVGRKDEAVRLARDYAYPPKTARDVVRLASAYASLGLLEEALKFLQQYASGLGYSEDVWLTYANVALAAKSWEQLRRVALQVRQLPALQSQLRLLSYYYEGHADHATQRKDSALRAFEQAAASDFSSPAQALSVAKSVIGLGYAAPARTLLERMEMTLTNNLDYWDTVANAADMLRDSDLLLKAARAGYNLQPNSAVRANRYAGALVIAVDQPEEAVRMTFDLYSRLPDRVATRINYSLALLQNLRPDDAARILDSLAARYEGGFSTFSVDDFANLPVLASKLKETTRAVDRYVADRLSTATKEALLNYQGGGSDPAALQTALVQDLNSIISGPSIYDAQRFLGVALRSATQQFPSQNPQGVSLLRLNRLLLEDAYPLELSRSHEWEAQDELASYQLARFQLAVQQKKFAQARLALDKLALTRLFPTEQRWVERSRQLLPPNP